MLLDKPVSPFLGLRCLCRCVRLVLLSPMSELRDPAIKLFGRKIPLPECQILADSSERPDPPCQDKCRKTAKTEVEDMLVEESVKKNNPYIDEAEDNSFQTSILENETTTTHKVEEDLGADTDSGGQEKALKKPDKVLPCPRCNSLDTKFCYFNNYNVNQPRHFCKNCQRYWTAGGTMRNVPVGAGRRKNKHSSQFRQVIVMPDKVNATQVDILNSASSRASSCVELSAFSKPVTDVREVLKFGRDTPLCESMAAVLNLKDQNGVQVSPVAPQEGGEEPCSSSSSITSTALQENESSEREMERDGLATHQNSFTPHALPGYTGPPWSYHWNPGWNEVKFSPDSGFVGPLQWGFPPMLTIPGFCTPGVAFPSYWGCMPAWDSRKWNVPLVGSTSSISTPSSTSNSGCSGNDSPTLGKHSRDANLQSEEKTEKFLWVPKTLRIDDPNEAAKISIWDTLGIKPEKSEPIIKGGIFKAFQPKKESSATTSDANQVLQANPAAHSRSQSFQEST